MVKQNSLFYIMQDAGAKLNLSDWSEDDEYGTLAIYGKYLTDTEGRKSLSHTDSVNTSESEYEMTRIRIHNLGYF